MTIPLSPFEHNVNLRQCVKDEFLNKEVLVELGQGVGEILFTNIEKWLCTPPKFTTVRINNLIKSKAEIIKKLQDVLVEQSHHKKKPLPTVFPHELLPDVLIISYPEESFRILPHQKEVIVGLACGMSVLRGAEVYSPGILAAPVSMKKGDCVAVYADLDKKCLRGMIKPYTGRKVFVGNGIAVFSRHEIFGCENHKSGLAIEMMSHLSPNPSLGGIMQTEVFLQNLPSVICCHVLNPQPGDWVLDMCAAPGGKTCHLGFLMNNEGIIIALDKTSKKIEKLKGNVENAELSCVYPYAYDATKALDNSECAEAAFRMKQLGKICGPPYPPELFDCILLDAPCSALGQRPQLCNSMTPKELHSYPSLQKKLFKTAVSLLKVGGSLVYSTCTWTLNENEGLVKWVLDTFPFLTLETQKPHIGGTGLPGAGLSVDLLQKLQRFPNLKTDFEKDTDLDVNDDTIGFFISKFYKNNPKKMNRC